MQIEHPDFLLQLAEKAYAEKDYISAEKYLREALKYYPENAELYSNLGMILQGTSRPDEAAIYFQKAIQLSPSLADAHYNLGNTFKDIGRLDEAVACYRKSVRFDPENADAYVNLGMILDDKGFYEQALLCYQKALSLKPEDADIHLNLIGIILNRKGKLNEAIITCQKALLHNPYNPFVSINMGNAFLSQGKHEKAQECYRTAINIAPDLSMASGNLLCSLNYVSDNGEEIYHEHKHFAEQFETPLLSQILPHVNSPDLRRKLRIGYVSPDFRQHSVRYFIEPVLKSHSRDDFDIFCYANVPVADNITERLQNYADYWRNIASLTDNQAASLIREDRIDVLVDLAGHTAGSRILLFAQKPAPIGISWLGYPATTGLSAVDYKIVDCYTDPLGMTERFYTERLLKLSDSFICYLPDDSSGIDTVPATKNGHITFGSFNNFAKVTRNVLTLWAEILRAVPRSSLLLKAQSFSDSETRRYALDVFRGEGIEAERVELYPPLPSVREHLELYNRIDIALDTFPYNGTTTTCEALWMGVPVITLAGKTHASRVGVSILSNIGLKECIAQTRVNYAEIAAELAKNAERLQGLRMNLRKMMQNSLLTDAERFTKNLEDAYRMIWERWCSGSDINKLVRDEFDQRGYS